MAKKTSGSTVNRNRIDRKFIAKTESEIANSMPLPKNELPVHHQIKRVHLNLS